MTTGTITIMTTSEGLDGQGMHLAQKVRALTERIGGGAMPPSELWADVMDTLSSAVQTVQMQEDRMLLVERAISDTLWECDLAEGTLRWNANAERLLGYGPEAVPPSLESWKEHIHPEDRGRVLQTMESVLARRQEMWTDEYRFLHTSGNYVLVRDRAFARYDESGHPTYIMGAMQEVVALPQNDERVAYDALHDALTGLPNRQLFLDRLGLSFERAQHSNSQLFAIIFLDIDRFRSVNESYGHAIGDALLRAVVQRMDVHLRASDSFARLGSDEFAVLLEDLHTHEDALEVCGRIQVALTTPFTIDGFTIFVGCTMGVAFYGQAYTRPDELLRDATIAMSRARTLQPGSLMVFDALMHTQAVERIRIEADLRLALEREEFLLHFQPVVTTAQKTIVGVEALVRWKHPIRGLIPPADFIPIAEETGLIVPLGGWILRAACRQVRLWHAQGYSSLYVAVNISARQFNDQDIVAQVARVLEETNFPADCLHLELTESTITNDMEATVKMLTRLKDTGVQLSIDDFGMGYSSLSYLKRFPINTVKIDRSFVGEMETNVNDAAIATAIIDLAHSLNLKAVAEGVETEGQRTFLQSHNCEEFQGYLCSPALPAGGLEVLLRAP